MFDDENLWGETVSQYRYSKKYEYTDVTMFASLFLQATFILSADHRVSFPMFLTFIFRIDR